MFFFHEDCNSAHILLLFQGGKGGFSMYSLFKAGDNAIKGMKGAISKAGDYAMQGMKDTLSKAGDYAVKGMKDAYDAGEYAFKGMKAGFDKMNGAIKGGLYDLGSKFSGLGKGKGKGEDSDDYYYGMITFTAASVSLY